MKVSAQVTDMLGRIVMSVDFGKRNQGMSKLDFDLSKESVGMYFIQVKANGLLLDTKKVSKQ
jgi:hypothetical protein